MALKSFHFENQRSKRLVQIDSVPKLMIVVGPNGVDKSTLLHAIKSGPRDEDPGTNHDQLNALAGGVTNVEQFAK